MNPLLILVYKTLQLCAVNQWPVTREYELSSPSKWIPVPTVSPQQSPGQNPACLPAPGPGNTASAALFCYLPWNLLPFSLWLCNQAQQVGIVSLENVVVYSVLLLLKQAVFWKNGSYMPEKLQTNFKNNWGRYSSTFSYDLCHYCSFSLFHEVFNEE